MNNLYIFGDSFSVNNGDFSWPILLSQELNVSLKNLSSNASSIFRIYKNIINNIKDIKENDLVICNYTNYQRVYINDDFVFKTRKKQKYENADLVISDAFNQNFLDKIFFKKFYYDMYDDDMQMILYYLMQKDIRDKLKKLKTIEITFFNFDVNVINLHNIWQNNKGKINHMNELGNKSVMNILIEKINHI